MGLNMWLPSVFDFNNEQQLDRVFDSVDREFRNLHPMESPRDHPLAFIDLVYDTMCAAGGYYREAYNGRGLLTLMGMSWCEIRHGLEDRTLMPPDHARHLLAELEARPFTKSMLFGEERHPDEGVNPLARRRFRLTFVFPVVSPMMEMVHTEVGQPPDPLPGEADLSDQEIDEAFRAYAQRRQELMALLRAAIERDEPLHLSG
jgi:hypothetical protein